MINGYPSSLCILLVARYSCDDISGEPRKACDEGSSRRITLIERDLSSQCVPSVVEAGPYRWVADAHSHSVPRSAAVCVAIGVYTDLRSSSRARSLAILSNGTVLVTAVIALLPSSTRNASQNLQKLTLTGNAWASESVRVIVWVKQLFHVSRSEVRPTTGSRIDFNCVQHHATLARNIMRGYHVRIVVQRKAEISQSHPPVVDTFTPKSIFEHLPSQSTKPTSRRNATFNPAHKDYRFGPIRLDWIDFENMSVYAGKSNERVRGTFIDIDHNRAQNILAIGPATATFVPHSRTKSGSTNLPEGVVHVYRDCDKRPDVDTLASYPSAGDVNGDDGVTLGVLAVPAWMTPSDFLAFVAPAAEGMAHLRLVRSVSLSRSRFRPIMTSQTIPCRDSVPNRSMALIRFRRSEEATEFIEAYNGKPFNSMDVSTLMMSLGGSSQVCSQPETCHVVCVLSVEIDDDDSVSAAIYRLGSPQSSMYELPTCPVCLERMDAAVTGLITVPCSHTFHCMCLSKWGDSRFVHRSRQTLRVNSEIYLQVSRVPVFSNSSVLSSYDVAFAYHSVCECSYTIHLDLCRLPIHNQPLDMPHLWKHWLRSLWSCTRSRPLPKHDASLCPRIRDPACLGLCWRWLCPPTHPKQGRWKVGRASLRLIFHGYERQGR